MPLHLLGKKSWNVYNADNIEKVKRDEAAAAARLEEEEQRMQEVDAERRIAILRGEVPPPLEEPAREREHERGAHQKREQVKDGSGRDRKRRRIYGEDDTDRDIRIAREDAVAGSAASKALTRPPDKRAVQDAPLHDHAGHINLFPGDEKAARKAEKNAEFEAEKAKKKRQLEDQYTMRFSNAAGFKQGLEKPWYASHVKSTNASPDVGAEMLEAPGKDVWGNEDPRRKEREKTRTSSSDPMAFMKKAQVQLKQSEKDKERWKRARETEIEELRRQEKRRRKRAWHGDDLEDLDGFSLDCPSTKHGRKRSRSGTRDRSHQHKHPSRPAKPEYSDER
ncbi:hypothetical protein LTR66_002127 [Elasticomyces elasticus]|nr:hypothetical protein LTR28_009021 [Elasticomyces elasticus]KAK4991905.1 hypothetical protein LTR50_001524 [Elasticomyces elasticus]KAK4998698.1 hypothetical protein LTR66_002127 [Elasticomyces elasticus]